ncbi:uncharacterized protein LOC129789786 [Lutzomyia longipalpis]|nr:uncharacterized protein LOC129789786 [Lutzomyia longipalpis]
MALFRFPWLRRFVRRNTRPIPLNTAETWRNRLSLGYMFLAWNAFGFVCYAIYNGKLDWAKSHGIKDEHDNLSQAQRFAKALKVENATVLHYSGFRKTGEFKIEKEKDKDVVEGESQPS